VKVLLAPLDWGLGHATRSLTLAKALEALGHEVYLASNGGALHLLRQALPGRPWWELPSYDITYSASGQGFFLSMLRQWPRIRRAIQEEHQWLHGKGKDIGFDWILSDGRYGLWHEDKPSVLVTHQIAFHPPMHWPLPGLGLRLSESLNRFALNRFTQVWIPDVAEAPGLASRLSHGVKPRRQSRFIGPLNRFAWEEKPEFSQRVGSETAPARLETPSALDWLAVISGPEPQRQAFENKLRVQLQAAKGTRVLVLGKPGARPDGGPAAPGERGETSLTLRDGELNVFQHVDGQTLQRWLAAAKAVVTRSGYTTVMELACLGVKPILMVPTPGQPEQEYLAQELARGNWIATQNQDDLDLAAAMRPLQQAKGLHHLVDPSRAPGATREGLLAFLNREIPLLT
jgi:UDP:flavonoid glycosyltransferase YjiC (YdhE family)